MLRSDLEIIKRWIEPGSRVLDLGCGDGRLLRALRDERQVTGYGLEIDPDNIVTCVKSGLQVIQADLDRGLAGFDSGSFDYVVLTQTLQAVNYPDRLLDEMLRIGRQGIVTLPNFGYWVNRLQLGLLGTMPKSRALPATWYETRNIHLCTLKDFEHLCDDQGIRIVEKCVVDHAHRRRPGLRFLPNLLGQIALYRCQGSSSGDTP